VSGAPRAERVLEETRFADVLDLARLPYFEVREGRLVLADRSLAGAIDVHTHLALAYGPRSWPNVDILRPSPETAHYLPARGRPIDFEVYINKNFGAADLARMKHDLTAASFGPGGMRATHTIPNLAREMSDLGISQSVLLPIDFPFWSRNAATWLAATVGRTDLICFGSVHPYTPGLERALDRQIAAGARGIKVHPAVQVVRPDNRRAMRLVRLCGEKGLPVLYHCGPVGIEPWLQRRLTQVRYYEAPLAASPRTQFVLGHAGALQLDEALALAARYPNVWLEVSSQSLSGVRRILAEADPERILYGTDWPFYHQAIQLAKVLIATEGRPALRRKVLRENAARLLRLAPATAST
jgi:predicted TIM-barrel fold metal-dependent hydrolase